MAPGLFDDDARSRGFVVAVQRECLPDRRRAPKQVAFRVEKLVDEVRRLRAIIPRRCYPSDRFLILGSVRIFGVLLFHQFLHSDAVGVTTLLDGWVVAEHDASVKLGVYKSPEKVVEDMRL